MYKETLFTKYNKIKICKRFWYLQNEKSLYTRVDLKFLQNITLSTKITAKKFERISIYKDQIQRQIPYEQKTLSMKKGQQQILKILEKKLVDDYQKQEKQQVSSSNIRKKEQQIMIIKPQQIQGKLLQQKLKNKLFQYFEDLFRKQISPERVQREKVNFCQKQFQQIKSKVYQKLDTNKLRLQELQKWSSRKYFQLHDYHAQRKSLILLIKQQDKNSIQELQKKNRQAKQQAGNQKKITLQNITLRPPSLKEKEFVLEQSMKSLKEQIGVIEQEIEAIKLKDSQIEEEWTNFLKLFLNYGYYLINGSDSLLQQLRKMKVKLTYNDLLTQILDQNSKKYLLRYYANVELNNKRNKLDKDQQLGFRQRNNGRGRIQSTIEMKSIVNNSNLKQIYSSTQQVMTSLLRKGSFKKDEEKKEQFKDKNKKGSFFLPKIQKIKDNLLQNSDQEGEKIKQNRQNKERVYQEMQNEKRLQINRINYIYMSSKDDLMLDKGRLMKRILFGFSVK